MADVVESLMAIPGVVGVARVGDEDAIEPGEPPHLLYYRGTLDTARLGEVGGKGDVISRDLDVVEHWIAEADQGRFEIDTADDWIAGRPTYALVGELATCEVVAGELPRPGLPAALRETAARRWRDTASRALEIAESRASRPDVAGCAGLLAKAAIAIAQARLAERGEWALGEAGIVRRAGLGRTEAILAGTGDRPIDLERAATRMRIALGLTEGADQAPAS